MHQFDKSIIEAAILHYGMEQESIVCIEECSELQKEITKQLRGQGNRTAMVLEMADVLVSIELLKKMYGISDDVVNDAIRIKQRRTARIIQHQKDEGRSYEQKTDIHKRPFGHCKEMCDGCEH